MSYGYASGYMPLKAGGLRRARRLGAGDQLQRHLAGRRPGSEPDDAIRRQALHAGSDGAPPFTAFKLPVVAVYEDDVSVVGGQARLRFIHAADGQSGLEFGSGSSGTYTRNFSASDYTKVGDAAGQTYLTVPAAANGTYSLRVAGQAAISSPAQQGHAAGRGRLHCHRHRGRRQRDLTARHLAVQRQRSADKRSGGLQRASLTPPDSSRFPSQIKIDKGVGAYLTFQCGG